MVIAGSTSSLFTQINATTSGKKDMEDVIKSAKDNAGMYGKKTILFIDVILTISILLVYKLIIVSNI